MTKRVVFGAAVLAAAGCGAGVKIAPVSGTVTLNGKPRANATISFQPIVAEGSMTAGPGSVGKTNEKGEYSLTASSGTSGAWVGKHRVMITLVAQQAETGDERPPRGGWPQKETIPDRYNAETKLTYDVPPGGSDKANFELTSP
jgi:hypothetical protein